MNSVYITVTSYHVTLRPRTGCITACTTQFLRSLTNEKVVVLYTHRVNGFSLAPVE